MPDEMTEQEEAALGAATLAAARMVRDEEVVRIIARSDVYRAMVVVLLDEDDTGEMLLYLTGMARIGIDMLAAGDELNDEDAATHRRVMAVLAREGAEPMSVAAFKGELKSAAQGAQFRRDAGPTLVD